MRNYDKIQPEVIVGLGDHTEFLEKEVPFRTVVKLHIDLEDWLGDDLMECHPCYIVTESLKIGLESSEFTGFKFDEMRVTKGEYFDDNYQLDRSVPKFYWMKINGEEDVNDFYIDQESSLFANKKLISHLKKYFQVKYLDINPERNEFDDLLDQMIAESKKNK